MVDHRIVNLGLLIDRAADARPSLRRRSTNYRRLVWASHSELFPDLPNPAIPMRGGVCWFEAGSGDPARQKSLARKGDARPMSERCTPFFEAIARGAIRTWTFVATELKGGVIDYSQVRHSGSVIIQA
jgi:hypothetical protein